MENKIKTYRWPLMINGFIALLFGLFVLISNALSIYTLAKYFGIVLMIGGAIGLLISNNSIKKRKPFMSILVSSIFIILLGLFVFIFTQKSLVVFAVIIAIWAVLLAIIQFLLSFKLTLVKKQKNMLLFNGLVTLIFGAFLFFYPTQIFNPIKTSVIMGFIAGLLAIVFGGVLIYFSIIMKNIEK